MWYEDIIEINGIEVQYRCQCSNKNVEEGIDGGKIQKLAGKIKDKPCGLLFHYYNGRWDMKPQTELAKNAYEYIVKKYN